MCEDHEKQFKNIDPYIFPAEMDPSLLKLVPETVVMTREFDYYRMDAEYYADKLQQHGRLLEKYIQPGTNHYTKNEQLREDKKKLINYYI